MRGAFTQACVRSFASHLGNPFIENVYIGITPFILSSTRKYASLVHLVATQVVEKFGKMINPFGHADQTEAYAEAQQTSNVGNEIDDAKLVLFDDARIVGLLEEDLQHDQVITRITNQQLLVLGGYLGCAIEGITGYVANPFQTVVIVVCAANVARLVSPSKTL